MAITFGALGTTMSSTTSPTTAVPYPAGWTPYNMLLMGVATRLATPPTVTTPTGWNTSTNNSVLGGTGTFGADAGQVRLTVFWRISQPDDNPAGPTLTTSANGDPTFAAIWNWTKAANELWDTPPLMANAADTTGSTTSYDPPASATTIALGTGDQLVTIDAINGDIGTWTVPGTLTVTGVTFASIVNRGNQSTITGTGDARLMSASGLYSSGTASAGFDRAITVTTGGADTSGASVAIRLRVTTIGPGRATSRWRRTRNNGLWVRQG